MKKLIYVVDDEPLQLQYLQAALRKNNYHVQAFSDPLEMLDALEARVPDAAVVDLVMPQLSGIELIQAIRTRSPKVPLIAVTAYPEIETAIGAVRAGANDYLKKPFQTAELHLVVERLLASSHLRDNLDSLLDKSLRTYSIDAMVGTSPFTDRIRTELTRLAAIPDANVIISGENGAGKSFAARILHYAHADASKRLIEINCAAMSREDLEAELFGEDVVREDGTIVHHPSLCEVAAGGTVLLDYVTDMEKPLQNRLFKLLSASADSERIYPCRIIVSTTLDLASSEAAEAFDPELYNHLSPFHLHLTPLRERMEDVIPLAEHFIAASESSSSVRVGGLTEAAKTVLTSYDWPGNVRELRSVIERALVTTQTQLIDAGDLHTGTPYHTNGDESTVAGAPSSLREIEIEQIRRVLAYTGGDVTKAAQILGISRKSLWERRKRYSID